MLTKVIFRELLFRRWNTVLSCLAVAVAVLCVQGAVLLLRLFDKTTERLVAEKELAVKAQMAQMEDEYRKITKRMGFNVVILPRDQDLSDFYSQNYADKFMPEDYARRLATATNIVTVRHLLPMLQQKVEWPEQHRRILLIGVQGRMTWAFRADGDPLVKPVAPGTIAVGYELHRVLGLKTGDSLVFRGKSYKVSALHPERGTVDDITLWMDLADVQTLLDRPGQISSIVALECECAWANLPKVRQEIAAILPDIQVIELAGKALARAEARQEAAKQARDVVERERQGRTALRNKRQQMIAVLAPAIVLGCAAFIGLLAWINVRDRRIEVGVLRALGYGTLRILSVFLGKAVCVGFIGSLAGTAAGLALTPAVAAAFGVTRPSVLLDVREIAAVLAAAPLMAVAASWLPALLAAREDPADVLRDE